MSEPEFSPYGDYLCPMRVGEYEWIEDEDGVEDKVYALGPCREPLWLVVHLNIPITKGDRISRFDSLKAVTSAWEARCNNGHVLAVSCEDESAEAFDAKVLEALWQS